MASKPELLQFCIGLYDRSCLLITRILDVWDICQPALRALGYDVKIGDVQPSCGKWTESQVECTINGDLFATKDSYSIHITSSKVSIILVYVALRILG